MSQAANTRTMTVEQLCKENDRSLPEMEKALASLQAKGLVTGYVPGDPTAVITVTSKADIYKD